MPHNNWSGVISFGLVNIPIVLYNSEDTSEKISFHQIDKTNLARIRYERVNDKTGKKVDWKNIIKGYQYDKETILPVDEDEIEYVAKESARTIAIEKFIDKNNIDFINVEKTYYLVPAKKAEKAYVILREALKSSEKIGIAKVIISTREYLAAVACYKNALVLYLLRYAEEIRSLSKLDIPQEDLKSVKATTQEVKAAQKLISSMCSKWQPEKYKDEFSSIVHRWAEKKIKKVPIRKYKSKKAIASSKKEINFVELLKQSLAQTKQPKSKKEKDHLIFASKKLKSGHHRATLH